MADTRTQIQARYDAKNRKTYSLKLNLNYDGDIIKKLSEVESVNGYIRQLISEDLARTGTETVCVPFPVSTLAALKEQAEKTGLSVPDLVKLIVSEQLIRT